jgi:hypothetical protein
MILPGRIERRMSVNVIACLASQDAAIPETVTTENISEHGARVISGRQWNANERVVVSDLFGDFRVTAEVVYCERVKEDQYAMGLKFDEACLELAHGVALDDK